MLLKEDSHPGVLFHDVAVLEPLGAQKKGNPHDLLPSVVEAVAIARQ